MELLKCLMVQGTTSDAGKSTLVAALCRYLKNKNLNVAPFKPQNMALNSAVTADGGEIGRAQALQALACKIPASVDMNPVLIKPSSDTSAQIIIHGKVFTNMNAKTYHDYKPVAQQAVLDSFKRLQQNFDAVIVEGAGSPAEINLREGDIANMGFAEAVNCPVILIADIDKGGVFAHIVGTLELLSKTEQDRIIGFVINRFRGDITLLQSGLDWLEQRTGKPVLAVLPYLQDLYLQAEDAIEQQQMRESGAFNIVVPVLPRISNHTDFDSLRLHPKVNLTFVSVKQTPPPCDLIILPGSKNVRDDLQTLIKFNWPNAINKHLRYGGKLIGLCGGYQMLGELIEDFSGIESAPGSCKGLGLLPLKTVFTETKTLKQVHGKFTLPKDDNECASVNFQGYEIHHGHTSLLAGNNKAKPLLTDAGEVIGHLSDDRSIFGTYIHGIFDNTESRNALLIWAGLNSDIINNDLVDGIGAVTEVQIQRLASMLEATLDTQKLNQALQGFYNVEVGDVV